MIKSFVDIALKINSSIDYVKYTELYNEIYCIHSKKGDPFIILRQHKKFLNVLLQELYKTEKISYLEYRVSLVWSLLHPVFSSVKALTVGMVRFWRVDNLIISGYHRSLTCSKGYDRARSFFTSDDCYDLPLVQMHKNPNLLDKFNIIYLMFKCRCTSYWNVAQYFLLKKDLPELSGEELVIEEGADFTTSCVYYLVRDKFKKIIYTFSTPFPSGVMKYEADELIVNSRLTYEGLARKNTVLLKSFPPNIHCASSVIETPKLLGYGPDIPSPIITKNQVLETNKSLLDYFIENNLNVEISIHPQDNKEKQKLFWEKKMVCMRNKLDLNEYFSGIDIYICLYSTMIFQAIYCNVYVIIYDPFFVGISDKVNNITSGKIIIANNVEELNASILEYRLMSNDKKKSTLSYIKNAIFF